MTKTKVLICMDNLSAGGVESQTVALIKGLDKSRFYVEVLCFYGEKAGFSRHFMPELESLGVPLKFLDLAYSPQDKARAFVEIIRRVWRSRSHILHAVNYHGNLLCAAARPFLPPGTRLIGASYTETTPKQLLYQRLSWRLQAAIICNSPHLVEQLNQKAHIPLKKIAHIPNGLYVERYSENPDPEFRRKIAPDANLVLLMVTRISPRKAAHLLPEAMGALKSRGQLPDGIQAFIVGEKEDQGAQQQLETAIEKHGLQDCVHQHPPTDRLPAYYHAADVTVLVSLSGEGLPNVVLESLAAGRPMIVSEAANRTGVIQDGLTGWLVRTGDVEHLAEALHKVINRPTSELAAMRHMCQTKAAEYDMQKMVQRHEALYDKVLS